MANIKIAGDAVVVTSSMKFEDLQLIKKYRPKALSLKGGEDGKQTIFSILVGTHGTGDINEVGATFCGATHDEEKLAVITMGLNGVTGDIKEAIADQIGYPVMNLNKLEALLPAVVEEIRAEKQSVLDSIAVI